MKKGVAFRQQLIYNTICVEEHETQKQKNARLAQLVEHLTLNQGVQGSNPWRRTKNTVFADKAIAAGTVFFMFYGKVKNKGVWEIERNEVFTPLRRKFHKGVKVFYAADSAWRTQGQAGKYLHAEGKTAAQDADKLSL